MQERHEPRITQRSSLKVYRCWNNLHKQVLVRATNGVSVMHLVGLDSLRQGAHDEFSSHVQWEVRGRESLDGLDVGADVATRGSIISGVER